MSSCILYVCLSPLLSSMILFITRMLYCIFSSWKLTEILLLQLQSGPPLDEISIACILRDLLHAIEYLHNEGKIHRDIKGILPLSLNIHIAEILRNFRSYFFLKDLVHLIYCVWIFFPPSTCSFVLIFQVNFLPFLCKLSCCDVLYYVFAAANILLTENGDVKV